MGQISVGLYLQSELPVYGGRTSFHHCLVLNASLLDCLYTTVDIFDGCGMQVWGELAEVRPIAARSEQAAIFGLPAPPRKCTPHRTALHNLQKFCTPTLHRSHNPRVHLIPQQARLLKRYSAVL